MFVKQYLVQHKTIQTIVMKGENDTGELSLSANNNDNIKYVSTFLKGFCLRFVYENNDLELFYTFFTV